MAKEKKNNTLMYAIIAVVVVVAIVIGVVVAVKKNGGGDGTEGGSTSKIDDYKKIDLEIKDGDYDGMLALAKDIQNGEATGKVVKIEGYVSHPLSAYSVVVPNADDTEKIGTQFVIDGDGEYPEEDAHIVITGKVVEVSPMYFVIQTLPSLIVTK